MVNGNQRAKGKGQRAKANIVGVGILLIFAFCLLPFAFPRSSFVQSVPYRLADPNNVRYADGFAGANLGAKIAAAIADLPSTGGTVDARGLEGAQTISTDIFSGVTKPVILQLGAGTITLSAAQTISGNDITIEGGPGTTISVTHATANMFTITGDRFSAKGLKFTAGVTRTAGEIFYLSNSSYSTIEDVSMTDAFGGIKVTAGVYNKIRNITLLGTGDNTWKYGIWVEDGPGGHMFENITGVSTGIVSDAWIHLHRRASANKFTNLTFGGSTGSGIGVRLTQEVPTITAISRASNVVTATLSSAFYSAPNAVAVSGVTDSSFDGFYGVSTVAGNRLTWAQVAGDTSSSGGSLVSILDRPELNRFNALFVEPGAAYPSVKVEGGQDNTFTSSYFAGGLRGFDISGESTGTRIENSILVNSQREAIKTTAVSQAGAGYATLHVLNNDINASSNAANNTYDAISIGAGVSDFIIANNRIGLNNFPTVASDARYGVSVATGASSRYQIVSNNFANVRTAGILDGGTGTDKEIWGNVPDPGVPNRVSGMNLNVKVVSFSATPTFDVSLGDTQKITLTGDVTRSTLSNATAGQSINFIICQDSGGSHTFVWPTNVKGGMTIGSTLSTCSAQSFRFDGTNAYATSAGVTNM
jgi:hypothetical protein